jgi:glycosyltransferase involved in cell wall biosynthesis
MLAVSVVICTLNPRSDYLARVLQALRAQELPMARWELLLVDNGSTHPLCSSVDLSWHPSGRHVREDTVGLTSARLRGIRESQGDLLVFVDDDNVLAPDYLSVAIAIAEASPHLGVFGAGTIEGEFEAEPPSEIRRHVRALALRTVARANWSNNTQDRDTVPWGPGLCVKRRVASAYRPLLDNLAVDDLIDRKGEFLFGNGDVAFSWAATTCDLGFGVFPRLCVRHLISRHRVMHRYFLRLAEESTYSASVLDYRWDGILPSSEPGWLERIVRIGLRGARRGIFAMRYGLAVDKGMGRARAYIRQCHLQPLSRTHAEPGDQLRWSEQLGSHPRAADAVVLEPEAGHR